MCLVDIEGGMKMINTENQQKIIPGEMTAKLLRDKKTVWSQIAKFFFTPIVSIHRALNATVDPKHNQAINKIESHFWREAKKATTLINKNREPALDSIRSEPIPCSTGTGVKQGCCIYKICGSMVTS